MDGVPQTRVFDTPRRDPLREVDSLVAVVAKLSVTIYAPEVSVCYGFRCREAELSPAPCSLTRDPKPVITGQY